MTISTIKVLYTDEFIGFYDVNGTMIIYDKVLCDIEKCDDNIVFG